MEATVDESIVVRFARLLGRRGAARQLLVGDLVALGATPEATFVTDGASYRVRLLDKRADLLTYLRFADVPARSCFRSDSYYYDCGCHGTQRDVIYAWKDPLTFGLHIERLDRGGFTPRGFFFGGFADLGSQRAVVMNSLHVRPNTPAVRFAVLDYLERAIAAPLGLHLIGVANAFNGFGALPDDYEAREVQLVRYRALRDKSGPMQRCYDDIGGVNHLTNVDTLYWRAVRRESTGSRAA